MKISLNWVKDFIDLSGISTEEIVSKLTFSGLEIEELVDQKKIYENFVVGYVKEKKKHPNADKLSLCVVSDGTTDYPVVCGAPNVESRQKIVFAKIGAVIPESRTELKKVKIRGEISEGMICSGKELGISDDHTGIMVLDNDVNVGMVFSDLFEMNDIILEVNITPNRADAFSHFGIARELGAIFNRKVELPNVRLKESKETSTQFAKIKIQNTVDCPRYVGKVVKNITVSESPEWMKKRLRNVGLRPINNIVDVTNYVLFELGQPLHAFDLDKLSGSEIIVRSAGSEQKFTTLDSKERLLQNTDLLICDADKPIAIAGVMGGENSEVTTNTNSVLIESAYFRPSAIRKTSKKLGLSTDSSMRFERGCNVEITNYAARRAAQMMAEISGGSPAQGEIDIYPEVIPQKKVSVRFSRITKILGYKIPDENIESILLNLGFEIDFKSDEEISVIVPLFRHDIQREVDLIEEIARIYGYENIPDIKNIKITLDEKIDQSDFVNNTRNILTGLGLNEIITNSLLSDEAVNGFGNAIKILNPQSFEMSNARTSLIPGTLITISNNLNIREKNLGFYEIGHVFEKLTDGEIINFEDFKETKHLLISLTGSNREDEWYGKSRKYDIFDLKGLADAYLNEISLDSELTDSYYKTPNSLFDYYYEFKHKDNAVGVGGRVKKAILSKYGIDQDVFIFDFNLSLIENILPGAVGFKELLKYPKIIRDCSFVVDNEVEAAAVIKVISNSGSKLLKKVKLFDIFESESLGQNKKSLAFQLEFYDFNKTLTEEEVEKDFWNAIELVKKNFNSQLRGQ